MRLLILSILLLCAAESSAQTIDKIKVKEMNVDLPDETEETELLEKSDIQVETQFLYNKFNTGNEAFIGQALIRAGLFNNIEGRLLVEEGKERNTYIEETVQSTFPLAASLKVAILKEHIWLPDMSLVGYIQLPFTAKNSEHAIYWSPIFLAAFQNKIGKKFKIDYNIGIQQEAFSTQWVWLVNSTLHYKVLENLELFGEYYAQYSSNILPQHNVGGGIAYQVNEHFEVYSSSGTTIDTDENNFFVSSGVAYRLK